MQITAAALGAATRSTSSTATPTTQLSPRRACSVRITAAAQAGGDDVQELDDDTQETIATEVVRTFAGVLGRVIVRAGEEGDRCRIRDLAGCALTTVLGADGFPVDGAFGCCVVDVRSTSTEFSGNVTAAVCARRPVACRTSNVCSAHRAAM